MAKDEHNRVSGDEEVQDRRDKPAAERRKKRERVEKPGPHTIDKSQADVAEPQWPIDTPR